MCFVGSETDCFRMRGDLRWWYASPSRLSPFNRESEQLDAKNATIETCVTSGTYAS